MADLIACGMELRHPSSLARRWGNVELTNTDRPHVRRPARNGSGRCFGRRLRVRPEGLDQVVEGFAEWYVGNPPDVGIRRPMCSAVSLL